MATRRASRMAIEPALNFTIPSLHDSLQLDARIYNAAPRDPEAASGLTSGREGHIRGAIVAHPYAPTGGSQDDRVVMAVVETLVAGGWTVGTFNFRGVKGGPGSTSWTAKPEVSDYKSMLGLMTSYLSGLAARRGVMAEIDFILGGYSYGSLIVSQLGNLHEILATFTDAVTPSPAAEINTIAADLVKRSLGATSPGGLPTYDTVVNGGPKTATAAVKSIPVIHPSFLLVSPLLPPIAGMLQLSIPRPLKALFRRGEDEGSSMENSSFTTCPTFAIFGSNEEFTSARKLAAWGAKMSAASPQRRDYHPRQGSTARAGSIVAIPVPQPVVTAAPHLFEWDEIEDAGHFWKEPSVDGILRGRIRDWAATL